MSGSSGREPRRGPGKGRGGGRGRDAGGRRRSSQPETVRQVLDHLKATTQLGKQLELTRIWEEWPALAGKHLSPHGSPITVRDGTLYVAAESPVWMHRFAYHKWAIIKRANRMMGREVVSDIFVLLEEDEAAKDP